MSFLTYTPVINWLSKIMTPLMQLIGLPGEATVPIVLGALVSVYAGIAAVVPLGFDVKELTIIAAILLIAHDIPIEAAVSKKTGSTFISLIIIRIIVAFVVGAVINLIM
ncbi:MAG: nucleoside recognition protein [Thermosyntropha sp.]|nr:nucleoside recognition protein [Thermosyntropha sp.]